MKLRIPLCLAGHTRRSSELLNEEVYSEGKGRDSLVVGDGRDYLRAPKTGSGWLDQAQARIPAAEGIPCVTAHALRHTAASLAISAGATPLAVQRMLGHANAAMTLQTYNDLFEDDLDRVAAGLGEDRAEKCGQNVGKRP